MGVELVSFDENSESEESVSTDVSLDENSKPEEKSKLEKKVQDLMWTVNVLRARSKQDQKRKQILKKKNEILEKKFWSFEGYKKRQTLQEKALADLREEAEELRQKHQCDQELLKEMDEALAFRLKEVDQLNLSAQMMSNHIKQLEGGLVATNLVEMEEAEEPRGSQRRAHSLPPRPEAYDREEAAERRARVKAMVQYPVEPQPREEDEEYEQWANCQIMRLREGAININRVVRDLREGSAEAVRLRLHGIAGN